MKVEGKAGFSEFIDVSKGVLQGETLSPLLFAIFISDFESFLRSKGVRGVSVSHITEILLLAYADDIVLFADDFFNMKRIVKALFEYCIVNKLEVNIKKTKVVVFRKGGHGHTKNLTPFKFGDQFIDYVKEYEYLGILVAQSASYVRASENIIARARAACISTVLTCHRLNVYSWETFIKLFQALVSAVLVYGAPVYAIKHLDSLEKIQLLFYKRLLGIPSCTANYAVRLETGQSHMSVKIFSETLNWIIKILYMEDTRYPKICFFRQLELFQRGGKRDYNWFSSLDTSFFSKIGRTSLLSKREIGKVIELKDTLLKEYLAFWQEKDERDRLESTCLVLYGDIRLQGGIQPYLLLELKLTEIKILAQIRLTNIYARRIIVDGEYYKLEDVGVCLICGKQNDFIHKIIECEIYQNARSQLNLPVLENKHRNIFQILEQPRYCYLRNLIKFVKDILENAYE